MVTKRVAVLLMVGLIVAACGSPASSQAPASSQPQTSGQDPTSTQPPSSTDAPGTGQLPIDTNQPSGTDGPPASDQPPATDQPVGATADDPLGYITEEDINPPPIPLPEPELTTVDEITEAMFGQGMEEQAIVSMLAQLGLGLYHADGTAIRTGSEQSDEDFYLFEDEAFGLVEMLKQQFDGLTWMDFRDFHAAMTDFGYEGSAEDLIADYSDAYAESPDAPMTRFVQAQAFLEVEAQIPPLGVWLLFVDGMIPPNGSSTASASINGRAGGVAQGPTGSTGVAYRRVQARRDQQAAAQSARDEARILAFAAGLTVEADPGSVHEGHRGALGAPSTITALVKPFGTSPFSGAMSLQSCTGSSAGIPIKWDYPALLPEHGTATAASGSSTPTDARGSAQFKYTPQTESANEHGYVVRRVATITASTSKVNLIRALCGQGTATRMTRLVGRDSVNPGRARLAIAWHERNVMRITLTNDYDIDFTNQVSGEADTEGQDRIDAVLVQQDDGSWAGAGISTARGEGTGLFGAVAGCPTSWNASQVLEIFGENRPGVLAGDLFPTQRGNFVMVFYPETPPRPAFGTSLCSVQMRPGVRYNYLPFNDARAWNTDIGFAIVLPPVPPREQVGGRVTTLTYLDTGGPSNVVITNFWDIQVEYPQPPPENQ